MYKRANSFPKVLVRRQSLIQCVCTLDKFRLGQEAASISRICSRLFCYKVGRVFRELLVVIRAERLVDLFFMGGIWSLLQVGVLGYKAVLILVCCKGAK